MKFFCKREVQGAISLFLVAILLPLMVISALMVDTARYQLAKSMVASAGDLAMNAALADYDTVLKDVYGLFAMSQADDIEKNVRNYFEETVVSYGVVGKEDAGDYVQELLGNVYEYLLVEDKETADFLSMTMEDSAVKVNKVEDSSLANASVLEKQIVEYMKYRAPVGFGMSFLDSLSAFTKVEKQTDVVQAQVNAQYSLEDASKADAALYAAVVNYDRRYETLEQTPQPDNGRHLKNYGHIFRDEYVTEYEKLHRLALDFCVGAYLEKWDLPDSNQSDSGFVILNSSGNYIVQGDGSCSVSGRMADSNTSFGKASSDPLERFIDPFLKDKANIINVLTGYGSTANITIMPEELSNEGNWETATVQFKQVDDFYKSNYSNYIAALKQLDEYAIAMEAYNTKMTAEIQESETEYKSAQQRAAGLETERGKLVEKNAAAEAGLREKTEEEVQDGRYYLENQKKIEELQKHTGAEAVAAEAEIAELKQSNLEIADRLGEELAQITQDLEIRMSFPEADGELEKKIKVTQEEQNERKKQKEKKEEQLASYTEQYQAVLSACRDAVNCFNQDAVNYKKMKQEIRAIITRKAVAISGEFKLLQENVNSLERLLAEAETRYGEAWDAITKYKKDVENWSETNNNYKSGGTDNFSDVQSADISEANNIFSEGEVKELLTKIQQEHEKVSVFLAEVNANFTYMGSSKIKDITNADQIAEAIQARADKSFDLPHNIDADRLNTLQELVKPVPCCSFLNYLHQTYKDGEAAATEEQKKEKDSYEEIKESTEITRKIEEDKIEKDSGENKYGYTYGNGTGFSSAKKADKDGLKSSKSESHNLLQGLGNAMETGRDKLYVMEYLFEYFSYNTIVQDLAREGGEKPTWYNSGKSVYEKYLDAPRTGSHVKINGLNNKNYGAEIEYVLFGNADTPSANVTAAYASIFAVRVLFNSVYAFTSSDIRGQTRAVALAVQAASGGIVPYQLVQVVLQLALAMAESAVDLKNLEAGAKVAIVKTKETWTLSVNGVKELAKGTVKTVADNIADEAAKVLENKINEITDATAQELSGAVSNVEKDLTQIANGAAENLLDSIFSQITAKVDEVMNQVIKEIFYPAGSPLSEGESLKVEAAICFKRAVEDIKSKINTLMGEMKAENPENALLSAACGAGEKLAGQVLDEAYKELTESLANAPMDVDSISGVVYKQIYSVKSKITAKVNETLDDMISGVSGTIQTEINSMAGQIKSTAAEATEEAKEKITKSINEFVDKKLSTGATKLDIGSGGSLAQANGNGAKSSSMASAITFGYSDYLRLFVFIGLCVGDKSGDMINRIAGLIETNIASAGEGSELHHRAGSGFTMKNAKTYISVSADVELEMMFLRLGIFQRQVESFNEEYEEDRKINLGDTIRVHYLGISGY